MTLLVHHCLSAVTIGTITDSNYNMNYCQEAYTQEVLSLLAQSLVKGHSRLWLPRRPFCISIGQSTVSFTLIGSYLIRITLKLWRSVPAHLASPVAVPPVVSTSRRIWLTFHVLWSQRRVRNTRYETTPFDQSEWRIQEHCDITNAVQLLKSLST